MLDLYIVLAKYIIALIMIFYSFLAFDVFVVRKEKLTKEELGRMSERQKNKKLEQINNRFLSKKRHMFTTQYVMIIIFHLIGYSILYLKEFEITVLMLGILELIFIAVYTKVYSVVYKGFSRLLFNNMLLLLDIGFVFLARLNFTSCIKQFIIVVASAAICLAVPAIIEKFENIDKYDWIYGIIGFGLLVIVLIFGDKQYGSTNWLSIGPVRLQPSEFVKIIFIFCMASLLSKYKDDFKKIVIITIFAALHVCILALEKDLGAALLFFMTYIIMLYIATKKKGYVLTGFGLGSAAAYLAYHIPNYRHVRVRVNAWKNPWAYIETDGYQVCQALFAIGTGGWFGMGLTKGLPKSIPVYESDFIFAAICEETGIIVGMMIILVCLSCFIMFVNIAMLIQKLFYKLIAIGLSTMFVTQVLLNIGGVTKFIPSTGVTLPLISYGGSSIISTFIIFNVVQGMYVRKNASYLQTRE